MLVDDTYIWQSTVSALADLRLVCVDKDSWMTERPTSTITGNGFSADPSDGLLVDQVNSCIWLRL